MLACIAICFLQLSWKANKEGRPLPFPDHHSAARFGGRIPAAGGQVDRDTVAPFTPEWDQGYEPADTGGASSSSAIPVPPTMPQLPVNTVAQVVSPLEQQQAAMQMYGWGMMQSSAYLIQTVMRELQNRPRSRSRSRIRSRRPRSASPSISHCSQAPL